MNLVGRDRRSPGTASVICARRRPAVSRGRPSTHPASRRSPWSDCQFSHLSKSPRVLGAFSSSLRVLCASAAKFVRPLFSYSYELLFPQSLYFHNHPHCPRVSLLVLRVSRGRFFTQSVVGEGPLSFPPRQYRETIAPSISPRHHCQDAPNRFFGRCPSLP